MGHQVNFYATPADVAGLEKTLTALEPMVIVHSRSPSTTPRVVPSLNVTEHGQRWLFYFLVRERDLSQVVSDHVPAQGYWSIDVLRSPVVEFTSGYLAGGTLGRGRVYYVDGFYGADNAWVDKPESFRRWATAVLKATRTLLSKRGTDYIGPDASAWLARDGGTLLP